VWSRFAHPPAVVDGRRPAGWCTVKPGSGRRPAVTPQPPTDRPVGEYNRWDPAAAGGLRRAAGQPATPDRARLRRQLRGWETASVSVGVMAPTLAMSITGGAAAELLGRAATLAFVVAAVGVALVASGFVQLSARYSHAGSVYAFVGRTLGPRPGFVAGWALLGTYVVFPPVSILGVAVFGQAFLRSSGLVSHVDWLPLAIAGWAVIWLLAVLGIRPTTRSLLAFEGVSVLLIVVLVAVVYVRLGTGHAPAGQVLTADIVRLPPGTALSTVALAATAGFLAFAGFESAGSLGEESREPTQAIPRAMVAAIGIGAVLYIACIAAQSLAFGTDPAGVAALTGSAAPLGDLAQSYVGVPLADALNIGAMLSAVAAGLGGVTVAARMLFAFGRDGLAPRRLQQVSGTTGVPRVALAVEMAVCLVLLVAFRLGGATALHAFFYLATIGVLNLLVMYVLTNLGAVRQAVGTDRVGAAALPAAGALVAGYVLYRHVWPVPDAPYQFFPYVIAGWLAVGLALTLLQPALAMRVAAGLGTEGQPARS
jgi:amino acid transporter